MVKEDHKFCSSKCKDNYRYHNKKGVREIMIAQSLKYRRKRLKNDPKFSDDIKEYQKEYFQRPEVKKRHRNYMRKYMAKYNAKKKEKK